MFCYYILFHWQCFVDKEPEFFACCFDVLLHFCECLIKDCPNLVSDILLNELGSTPVLLFQNLNHHWACIYHWACISVVSVACFVFHWLLKSAPWQLAPENTRRGSAYQTLPHQGGWLASDGVMKGMEGRSGRYHANEYYASPNDMALLNFNHIDIPNTETLVKKVHISQFGEIEWKIVMSTSYVCYQQVERVLSDPDVYTIERAKKLLIVSWFSLFP